MLANADSTDPFGPLATARQPVVTVPVGPVALSGGQPTIDKRLDIERGEYSPSACLHDLLGVMGEDPGVAGRYATRVWLVYTPRALYVAFRTEMPEGVRPVITITNGHDVAFADDAFELFLSNDDNKRVFHIGGSAGGIGWDRTLPAGGAGPNFQNWNPKIPYAAYVDRKFWSGEFEIPWSELGVEPAKDRT